MADRQLILDLGSRTSWCADDFLVSDANRAAVAWLDRWPDWPAPALVLYGPAGAGKTHLARSFAERTGGHALAANRLAGGDPEMLAGEAPVLILEDADAAPGPIGHAGGEESLLHLYNSLAAVQKALLMTARQPVRDWAIRLADLRSRLLAAPAVAIGAPDDDLLAAVLVKLFADRQLRVEDGVIGYLVARLERSFAAAQAMVARLDEAGLVRQRPVTVPLVRSLLAATGSDTDEDRGAPD